MRKADFEAEGMDYDSDSQRFSGGTRKRGSDFVALNLERAFAFVAHGMKLRVTTSDPYEPYQSVDWESVRPTAEGVRAYVAEWGCTGGFIVELRAELLIVEQVGEEPAQEAVAEPVASQRSLFGDHP